jgi:hypothetical protein
MWVTVDINNFENVYFNAVHIFSKYLTHFFFTNLIDIAVCLFIADTN